MTRTNGSSLREAPARARRDSRAFFLRSAQRVRGGQEEGRLAPLPATWSGRVSEFCIDPMHLPAAAALPRLCSAGFSIVSFNVLLPNSQDGWWLYKYYDNDTPLSTTLWPARASLLAERLLTADADIVMLQELSLIHI